MSYPKVRLADCCVIKPPKVEARKLLKPDDSVSFVPMDSLGINKKSLVLDKTRKLADVSGSYTYFAENDVLLAKITPCFENGKLGIASGLVNGIGFGSSEFIVFRSNGHLIPEYLYYFLVQPSFRTLGQSVMTGAVGHRRVPKDYIENTEIPLPSIPEQQRIVAILDQAFADIEKARANAEQNLKNARELFDSYSQQVFSQRGEGWVEKRWGDLCVFVRGPFGGSLKKSMFIESGYAVYEQKHAIHDHIEQLRYFVDEIKFEEMRRFEVKPGEIIMSCSGVTLGRVSVVPKGAPKGIINQALLKLTPNEDVNVHFLKYWLRSKIFQDIIFEHAGGAAIPNVPAAKILKEIKLGVPSQEQQDILVKEIDHLLSMTNEVLENYKRKVAALDELKKSLLQKAFSGELTQSRSTTDTKTTEFTAAILSYGFDRHESKKRSHTYGHVKAQKLLHGIESIAGIDLDRHPIQDAAGPNDFKQMLAAEDWAKEQQFFKFQERERGGYDFIKLEKYNLWQKQAHSLLQGFEDKINQVVELLIPMNSLKTEVFITLHAAWNNLILDGEEITDEAIILAARDNWHDDKLKIPRSEFQKALQEIRDKNLMPDGTTKYVHGEKDLFRA